MIGCVTHQLLSPVLIGQGCGRGRAQETGSAGGRAVAGETATSAERKNIEKSAIKNKLMEVFVRKCRHGEEDVFGINWSLIELIRSQQRTLLLAGSAKGC